MINASKFRHHDRGNAIFQNRCYMGYDPVTTAADTATVILDENIRIKPLCNVMVILIPAPVIQMITAQPGILQNNPHSVHLCLRPSRGQVIDLSPLSDPYVDLFNSAAYGFISSDEEKIPPVFWPQQGSLGENQKFQAGRCSLCWSQKIRNDQNNYLFFGQSPNAQQNRIWAEFNG